MKSNRFYKLSLIGLFILNLSVILVFVVVPRVSAATGCFPDTNGHWAEEFICWLSEKGITSGYPDGTYRPENRVTRAEMAVFLQQVAGQGSSSPVVDADLLDGLDSLDFALSSTVANSCRWRVVKEADTFSTIANCSDVGPDYHAISGGCYGSNGLGEIETCFPVRSGLRFGNGMPTDNYAENYQADGWYGRWSSNSGTREVSVLCCK